MPRQRLRWQFDRYALDGRNANTYTNILWCFGLHDRPFPEREVFGKLRPVTSASARRKLDFEPYFARVRESGRTHGGDAGPSGTG